MSREFQPVLRIKSVFAAQVDVDGNVSVGAAFLLVEENDFLFAVTVGIGGIDFNAVVGDKPFGHVGELALSVVDKQKGFGGKGGVPTALGNDKIAKAAAGKILNEYIPGSQHRDCPDGSGISC